MTTSRLDGFEEDLLGPRPVKKKKAAPKSDGSTQRCLAAFVAAFEARWRAKPHIAHGKDEALLKRLIATWDERTVLDLIERFFATTDPRVRRSNYTVGEFYALAQGLLIEDRRPPQGRTAENIHAGAQAMRPRTKEE